MRTSSSASDLGLLDDLIAYFDLDSDRRQNDSSASPFAARPLQMKAANSKRFMIDGKFETFLDLLLVYVWRLEDPARTFAYALSYPDALAIAEKMGFTATVSWQRDGLYNTSAPSKRLVGLLEPFRATKDRWPQLIRQAASAT